VLHRASDTNNLRLTLILEIVGRVDSYLERAVCRCCVQGTHFSEPILVPPTRASHVGVLAIVVIVWSMS
jgi:hypothetical protein